MEVLRQRVYTNNMPRLTAAMARKASRAIGGALPDEIDHTKDSIPPDVATNLRIMQEQMERMMGMVDSMKAANEMLKAENDKLKAIVVAAPPVAAPAFPLPVAPAAGPDQPPKPRRRAVSDPAIPEPEK